MHQVEILDDGRAISLTPEGGAKLRFHAIWLRDNAWDAGTRAPGNGQRLITIADIPSQIRISAARVEGNTLSLTFAPEGKTIAYDVAWLQAHSYDQDRPRRRLDRPGNRIVGCGPRAYSERQFQCHQFRSRPVEEMAVRRPALWLWEAHRWAG